MSERRALTDSGAGRVVGALVAPGDTFRAIAARPTWLAPLLVMMVLATVVGGMVTARIDMAQVIRHRLEAAGSQPSLEQIDQRVETMKKLQPYLAVLQGLIVTPGFYLVCALLFWMAFKLLGSDLSYKASFATFLYGLLPLALVQALLTIPVIWSRASFTQDEASSGSFLTSNLAALAPEGIGGVARALLASADLFSVWAVVLLAIGYRLVAGVSRATATGVVLGLWLLGVALKVALVAIAPG